MGDDLDARPAHLALQLAGRAARDDLAVVHDDDAVGQLVGLLEVLRGEEHGRAVLHEVADDRPHRQAAARVQARGGLVEDEQARPADEGAGEVEASAHAARVGLGDTVAGVDQVELLEQLAGASARFARGQLVEPTEEPEVLAPGEVLVHGRVLAGEADDAAQLLGLLDRVEAGHRGVTRVRAQQRGDDAHGGGLAGAVRAEQAQHAALRDGQVKAVQRAHLVLARAIDLDEALGFDDVHAFDPRDSVVGPPTVNPTIRVRITARLPARVQGGPRGPHGPGRPNLARSDRPAYAPACMRLRAISFVLLALLLAVCATPAAAQQPDASATPSAAAPRAGDPDAVRHGAAHGRLAIHCSVRRFIRARNIAVPGREPVALRDPVRSTWTGRPRRLLLLAHLPPLRAGRSRRTCPTSSHSRAVRPRSPSTRALTQGRWPSTS